MIQQFVPVQVDAGHCLVGFLGERLSNVKRFFCIIAIHPHQNQGKLVGLIMYVSGRDEPADYEGRRRKSRPSLPLPGVGPSAVGGDRVGVAPAAWRGPRSPYFKAMLPKNEAAEGPVDPLSPKNEATDPPADPRVPKNEATSPQNEAAEGGGDPRLPKV